tara:strand:- start:22415 stop:22519 length:105 start_codon:yes stop_codon:yes gene_type:complete
MLRSGKVPQSGKAVRQIFVFEGSELLVMNGSPIA